MEDGIQRRKNYLARIKLPDTQLPDPTKSSVNPDSFGRIREIGKNDHGREVIQDDNERVFHRMGDHNGLVSAFIPEQMFFARLLKGIVPVSDIVHNKETGEFYSYQIPLEDVGPQKGMNASLHLMELIFGTHDFKPRSGHNIQKQYGRHAFFDFEDFGLHFRGFSDRSAQENSEGEVKYLDTIREKIPQIPHSERRSLRSELESLHDRLEGSAGSEFIFSILNNIQEHGAKLPRVFVSKGGEIHEEIIERFQATILKRVETVLKGLETS